ncbi:DNA-processing protein DprA [uncultured Streptomyces sp.]|uniref:DNA-processing protein DprA n=1 Tax=uncultured Streptomyces sp. TaxID=174707 RepID=UPI0026149D06|nr:DNA-processing protein DprA [uncultured Streptomyces sp.]
MSQRKSDSIFLALVAFETVRTPARIDAVLREEGLPGLEELAVGLDDATTRACRQKAAELADRGIYAVLRGEASYPEMLIHKGKASAPVLFCYGNSKLLEADGVGMCGSRAVSDLGLKAAVACGEEVSSRGLSVISGYAKGVDTATHLAALRVGGSTVIVLAEGFDHFRIKKAFAEDFDRDRVLVVSQFPPTQPWLTHAAMTRNRIIFGLGRALVVVEAGERGGTLAAGEGAIRMGRTVLVLNFGNDTPAGNRILLEKGGFPIPSREALGRILDKRPRDKGPAQLTLPV